MTSISNTSSSTANTSSTSTSSTATSLAAEEKDFLSLLTAEIKNQDPTNPTDISTYYTAINQYYSLQEQSATNTSLSSLVTEQQNANTSLNSILTALKNLSSQLSNSSSTGTTTNISA